MKKMSPARRAAFKKMLARSPAIGTVRPNRRKKKKAKANKAKAGRGRIVSGATWHKAASKKKVAAPKKRRAAAKRKTTRKKKKLTKAQRRAISMKNLRKAWKKTGAKVKRGRQTRTYGQRKAKKRGGKKTGGYRALRARYGPRSRWTYKYTTKKGSVRDIPDHALLGYPSAAAMRQVYKTGSERERAALNRKLQRLYDRRERDADKAAGRIRAGRGMFTPNKADVLSYEEWEEMRPNARRKKTTKKKSSTRKPKYGTKAYYRWLGKKGAAAKKRKGGAKKKTTTRRKKAAIGRKPKYGTKAYYRWLGRKGAAAKKRKGGAKRTTARRKKATRRKPARRRTMTVTLRANRKRRRVRRNQGSYASNRRRRARRRAYRRNQGFMAELTGALKLGALVTAGFATHRALTHVIDTHGLGKIEALSTGELAKYRGIISGFLTAALGIGGVMATAKGGSKWQAPVAAGMAASFIHGAIVTALNAGGAQEAAAYLSNYPNAEGSMYGHAIGSYYTFSPHEVYSGMGSYYEIPQPMAGFGQPMLTQAAAGMGQPMLTQAAAGMGQPMLTQAAAGMGQITQAAAGTGEYVAVGVEGIGEYEETPVSGLASYTDEGIHPNLHSAEQALSTAEAAAGVGSADVPLQSTVNPTMIADPISDLPGGSRAGVFQGGDGIFG
jgi:hypothetical protein